MTLLVLSSIAVVAQDCEYSFYDFGHDLHHMYLQVIVVYILLYLWTQVNNTLIVYSLIVQWFSGFPVRES